ncbi:hypothetical protein RRG08_023127 [Elysia crispata]|uniref:Uncharacterized protein n=1 Tax=Elysia crispata TaxID=231223 RepID=A0AAE1CIW2_9GAST|nr:hypothetical protein RRG08_023127 [Elysia crispata]
MDGSHGNARHAHFTRRLVALPSEAMRSFMSTEPPEELYRRLISTGLDNSFTGINSRFCKIIDTTLIIDLLQLLNLIHTQADVNHVLCCQPFCVFVRMKVFVAKRSSLLLYEIESIYCMPLRAQAPVPSVQTLPAHIAAASCNLRSNTSLGQWWAFLCNLCKSPPSERHNGVQRSRISPDGKKKGWDGKKGIVADMALFAL